MRSWQILAGLAALAVAAQCYGVYRPTGPPVPPGFAQADKVEHAVGFGLPVALILAALDLRARQQSRPWSRVAPIVVSGIFVAHAVLSELVQHVFYRYRTSDPYDVLADSVGVALGVLICWLARRRSRARAAR